MSEWTPLAMGWSGWVRKYSEPPDFPWSVDAVHLISQDNNWTEWVRQGNTSTALPNTSTTIHVYDDPAVFCQARPMAIGLVLPIADQYGMGGFGGAIIPTVGELTIKVCNTPARTSGVYATLKRRILGAFALGETEEGAYTASQSNRSNGPLSGLPANLPLEEFWPLGDSFRNIFMFGPGYSMYVTQAIELEYGIIGSSPIGKVSLELEHQRASFYEPVFEVGVYNPSGSSSPIGFVGDPERPFGFSASFPVPLNFKASGDINPRSYASLTISSGSPTWTSPTITPYRGDSFSATVNVSSIRLANGSIYRRSVEFDQGQAVRGSGGSKWCRRVGYSYGTNGKKGAGNQTPKTKMVVVDAALTDQHRKQFTQGAFGFPLTQSQNRWSSIASNYTQGARVKLTNAYMSMRTSGVLWWNKEFQLEATNHHGVDLYPNCAYGIETELDETVLVYPSDENVRERPQGTILAPTWGNSPNYVQVMDSVDVSETQRFIDGYSQAIEDGEDEFEWQGSGFSYAPPSGPNRVMIKKHIVDQYTIQRVTAQSQLTLSLTNEYRSEQVSFSGTDSDATKATSGGVAANRQGVPVILDVFNGKMVAKFSVNLIGRKNVTKRVTWVPSNFSTGTPFMSGSRQVTDIRFSDFRMVEDSEINEPDSAFFENLELKATLTDEQLQQLTSTGTTTIGFSAGSGNTISGYQWSHTLFDYTIPINSNPFGETELQITLN